MSTTMSEASTLSPKNVFTDIQSPESSLETSPLELLGITSQPNTQTSKSQHSNLAELSWLFHLLTSNVTIITISGILTALLCHTFSSVRSGFVDICFNGTSSSNAASSSSKTSSCIEPSSESEESFSGLSEFVQWMELLTPSAPIVQQALSFLAFPIGPIAVSLFIVWNTEKVKEWRSGKDNGSKDVEVSSEMEVKGDLLVDPVTGRFWVAERRGSFTVQFDESLL